MSAVVGCGACGDFAQVPLERIGARCKCGGRRELVLTVDQNRERWSRGITIAEWFAAPRAPATRAGCEDGARPCPAVRCRHHLGVSGQRGCSLDVGDDGAQTLQKIGELLGVTPRAVARVIRNVRDRGVTLPDVPEDDEAHA